MVEICVYWKMFFLVSTSVAFVLISVALTEFCAEFECFSQDLTDVIDSAVNSTTFFTVSPSTVYNGVAWSRAALVRADKRSAPKRVAQIRSAFGSFFQCSSCNSVMMKTQGFLFHFSNWETAFLWLNARCDDVTGCVLAQNLWQLRKFASSCENCGVCLILR